MSFDPISGLIEAGKMAIQRIWPDPMKQAEEERKLMELAQNGDLKKLELHVRQMEGQMAINLQDSKSNNKFQANWRPAIGWVGAISLGLMYIPKALMMTIIWSWQCFSILSNAADPSTVVLPAFPDLGVTDIIGLLMSMLGMATLRSHDKKNGIDTKN